jgi:hypothetical protein
MKQIRLIKMCLNKTYNEKHVGDHLSLHFLFRMAWKKEIPASQFTFRICIRKIQENWNGLELNGTHQFLSMLTLIYWAKH